jgi:hypothetical protein
MDTKTNNINSKLKPVDISMDSKVKTEIGIFRVKISHMTEVDLATREIKKTGYSFGIGGNKDTCVFITINDGSDTGFMHNVKVRSLACETSGLPINGDKTVHMINLLFNFIKERLPHVKYIELDDNSEFPCTITTDHEKEKTIAISLALYELAFHQQTWYERYFGAKLLNNALNELYTKDGFYEKKPENFDFTHSLLQTNLESIYKLTSTWKEFFDEIYKYKERCKLLIPWYKRALFSIMGNVSFDSQRWIINLSNNKINDIPYIIFSAGGSRRIKNKTRKSGRGVPNNVYDYYDYLENPAFIIYTESDFVKN